MIDGRDGARRRLEDFKLGALHVEPKKVDLHRQQATLQQAAGNVATSALQHATDKRATRNAQPTTGRLDTVGFWREEYVRMRRSALIV